MKSLQESLFDKDLVKKSIGFFDYYKFKFGSISLFEDGFSIKLDDAMDDKTFNSIFKTNKKVPTRPYLTTTHSKHDQFILEYIYHCLELTPITQMKDKSEFIKVVSNTLKELIKIPTYGGGITCNMYQVNKNNLNIFNDGVHSITINNQIGIFYNKKPYYLEIYLSFARK